jgi:tRNA pseudouridine(38-40) synthase
MLVLELCVLQKVVALKMRSAMPLSMEESQFPQHPDDSVTIEVPEKTKPNKTNTECTNDNNPATIKMISKVVKEMDYVTMLNRSLPANIRVLSWTPVTDQFSARFSAAYRQYRYFFVKKDMNIVAMQKAASYFLGEHDFRNFCKLDIANVTNFRREIFSAEIKPFYKFSAGYVADSMSAVNETDDVYMLEIKGIAFLWHMVRCIMAVLFLVGQGLETPEIVLDLLDIERTPAKPGYTMADDHALVLHDCGFDKLIFQSQVKNLWQLSAHYQQQYEEEVIAAMRTRNAIEHLQHVPVRVQDVWQYIHFVKENKQRALQKINDKGVFLEKQRCGEKRKRPDSDVVGKADGVEEEMVVDETIVFSWREALELIKAQTGSVPAVNAPANVHIPLLQVSEHFLIVYLFFIY